MDADGWIAVTDRVPDRGQLVVCTFGDSGGYALAYHQPGGAYGDWLSANNVWMRPSHWAPLPSVPAAATRAPTKDEVLKEAVDLIGTIALEKDYHQNTNDKPFWESRGCRRLIEILPRLRAALLSTE